MSIRYTKINNGCYKVVLNNKEIFVTRGMFGRCWFIQTHDRQINVTVATKSEATNWLYKNVLKSI